MKSSDENNTLKLNNKILTGRPVPDLPSHFLLKEVFLREKSNNESIYLTTAMISFKQSELSNVTMSSDLILMY